ncbi:unnamed protein product [Schistocephalus solidus]|uniref:Tetraspanin n=1 Tax=Schistocephalus solidus TaxID=70667 RepID=A0A3P7CSI3_SCHSO|nr:unnamed protein product [Schistocephalus solidus]
MTTLFIFQLIGLTIVGLGIYLLVSGYVSEPDGRLSILAFPCIGLTILGIIPVFLAICGCWGALRFNRCCLGLYFTFLLFVFAAEIATGIAGVVYKQNVRDGIMQYLKVAVDAYQPSDVQKLTALDLIQVTFQCCGYESSNDYLKKLQSVPQSCCAYGDCIAIGANLSSDLPGCKHRAIDIESRTLIICAVIIALALIQDMSDPRKPPSSSSSPIPSHTRLSCPHYPWDIQLVGLVFSMILCCAAKDRHSRTHYQPVQS